eukprot:gene13849-18574_t
MSMTQNLKSESALRWIILISSCLLLFCSYYCYDIPAALHSQMKDYFSSSVDFETNFSLLYSVYSLPNIFLPFFAGDFINRFGIRLCLTGFFICVTVGTIIFAVGLANESWGIMLLGRTIFGLGGESLGVGVAALISSWFKGKELALAYGLNISIPRLGSITNNLLSPQIAATVNIQFSVFVGAIVCGFGLLNLLLVLYIDHAMDDIHNDYNLLIDQDSLTHDSKVESRLYETNNNNQRIKITTNNITENLQANVFDIRKFPLILWILCLMNALFYGCVLPFNNIASTLLLERDYFQIPPNNCQLHFPNQCQNNTNQPIANVCPSQWYQPPLPINITLSNGNYYTSVTPSDIDCTDTFWSNGCTKEFCSKLTIAQKQTSAIMSIPYIMSTCLAPFLGGFADKFGLRAIIAFLTSILLIIVHCLLGLTEINPIGPLMGQGLAYVGFAAVIWPSISSV